MAKKNPKPGFEEAMSELETILNKMENEDISLDESLSLYAKAASLIQTCNQQLQDAQIRVDEINQTLVPMENDEDGV